MPGLIAKYSGRCKTCGDEYEKGEEIYWTRDEGAHHLECKMPGIADSPKNIGFKAGLILNESIELASGLGFFNAKELDD